MNSKNPQLGFAILSFVLIALVISGCGSGSPTSHILVSVSFSNQTVPAGATIQVTAVVTNDPDNKGVSWSVSCAVAACGSVSPSSSASGVPATYTAPAAAPSSDMKVTITATSVSNGTISQGAAVTVPAIVVSASANSPGPLGAGQTVQVTATVSNDPANGGVNWTVSCTVAPCGSVAPASTASGVSTTYTAPPNAPSSDLNVTITATAVSDSTKTSQATVTIKAISVSVSPTPATAQVNSTVQFTATVNYDPASAGTTWTVTCPTAPCGSVLPLTTANGAPATYTAPTTPPASNLTVTLTATSVTDKTKSATATITVPSVGVSVTPPTATVLATATVGLTVTVAGDSSNKGVNWTVDCSPGPCGGVSPTSSASGGSTTYTAPPPPPSDLTVTVTATSVANSLAVGSATITVPAITVTVAPGSANVAGNAMAQLTPTVGNDLANKGVTWTVTCQTAPCGSVSPTSTASGTATTYTAPAPPANNVQVSVVATSVTDPTKSFSVAITVPAIKVSVAPPNGIIPFNATQDFTANVQWDAASAGVNWTLTQNGTSCSPACGSVSAASTASGTPTTYTAPAMVAGNGIVTLTATSVTDTTKSTSATITLASGTVKLIPATLQFTCSYKNTAFCTAAAQTVTLTNTGGSALTINSVTVTGTSPALFTIIANACPASVTAGASCTVSVNFHGSAGGYSAALTFDDSSSDSPQKVGLHGNSNHVRFFLANQSAANSDLAEMTSAVVPAPTGFQTVGTRVIHLTDAKRVDPYLNNGSLRELAVRLWYPAKLSSNQKCQPAPYTSPDVWSYFAQLVGVRPFPVKTNSCWEAPAANGVHPVVLFEPGFTASFTDYTYLTEDLASRGYVVAAIAHTYETTAVELSDGRIAKSVVGSHLGGTMNGDDRTLSNAVVARLLDLQSVMNELGQQNARIDGPLFNKLNLAQVAVAGHSLGGLTAFTISELDPRFGAAVIMDGFVPAAYPTATRKPVLILAAGRDSWGATECKLWNNISAPRLAVNLRGVEHPALGDWLWLTPESVQTGAMGPEKTIAAVRDYIAAFLDANLRGATPDHLLTGPASEYPDAVVTTQQQPLCAKP